MSNNAECTICTYINPDLGQDTKYNKHETLYATEGSDISICLCRKHSMELFKSGQIRFLSKYWSIASRYQEKGDRQLFDLMKIAVKTKANTSAA